MADIWASMRTIAAIGGFMAGSGLGWAAFCLVVGSFGPLPYVITGKKRMGG